MPFSHEHSSYRITGILLTLGFVRILKEFKFKWTHLIVYALGNMENTALNRRILIKSKLGKVFVWNLIHDNSQETFLLINILFDSQFLAVHELIRISLSANTFVFTCKFFLPFQVIPLRAFWILFQLKTKKAR